MENIFPIEIAVSLKGIEKSAMIFGRVPGKDGFHVRFNDGFEDEFMMAGEYDDLGPIGSKPGWEKYAPSLQNDFAVLVYLQDGQLVETFRYQIDSVSATVWIVEELPSAGTGIRYVYYTGKCRFKMKQSDGEWRVISHYSGDEATNTQLAKLAGQAAARLN